MAKPYKMIDLFSGAGGMTLGFTQAGFVPILAVEKEKDFAATYAENFGPHVIARDIAEIMDGGGIDLKADIVVGDPPSQGFSNLTENRANDPRPTMCRFFMDVVESTDCKVFVCANVPNLLKSPERHDIINRARHLGFHVDDDSIGILRASDFGVPQNRQCGLIIGSKLGPIALPEKSGKRMTVRQAFCGVSLNPTLEEPHGRPLTGPNLHTVQHLTEISLKRYRLIPPRGNIRDLQRAAPELVPDSWIPNTKGFTDLCGRLDWDAPARCTIRAEFYKPEKGRYLHPSEDRPITHWEASRLQTFIDPFRWHGTMVRIAMQIGNAVPPMFARAVASRVMSHMMKKGAESIRKPQSGWPMQRGFAGE